MSKGMSCVTLVTLFVVGCLLQWSAVSGCSERDRLVRDLTSSYLTSVEPDSAVLKTGLSLLCARYDDATGELVTNAWEKFNWVDKRLSWNPKDYSGITTLRLPSKLVWVPDFKLYNSLRPVEERDQTNVVIYSDGTVIWVPPVLYRTLCAIETPGAEFSCQIVTGSWTYDSNVVKLEMDGQGVDLDAYMNSTCPFAVDTATATLKTKVYPCCKEPYSSIEFNLRLKPKIV